MDNAVKRVLMDELEPDEARLLLLRMNIGEKRDMPYESIARIVGSDVISVRKKLNQIRKKLRKSTFVRNQWPAQWEAYNARQNKLREEEAASGPTYSESVVDMMESNMLENFRRP